jgi:hypothetical protein
VPLLVSLALPVTAKPNARVTVAPLPLLAVPVSPRLIGREPVPLLVSATLGGYLQAKGNRAGRAIGFCDGAEGEAERQGDRGAIGFHVCCGHAERQRDNRRRAIGFGSRGRNCQADRNGAGRAMGNRNIGERGNPARWRQAARYVDPDAGGSDGFPLGAAMHA